MLLRLERLPALHLDPVEAASVLIRGYAEPLRRWTEERRRLLPTAAGDEEAALLRRARERSQQLRAEQETDRLASLALECNIARWERQRTQYAQLRQRQGPTLRAELHRQRDWHSTAMQHSRHTAAPMDGATESAHGSATRSPRP